MLLLLRCSSSLIVLNRSFAVPIADAVSIADNVAYLRRACHAFSCNIDRV